MLSVEMKINGRLVVHLYGHNEGIFDREGLDHYYYELYELNSKKPLVKSHVLHNRDDGLVKLVSIILEDYLNEPMVETEG